MEHQLGSIKYKLKVKVSGHDVKNANLNLNILSSPAVAPNELFVSTFAILLLLGYDNFSF